MFAALGASARAAPTAGRAPAREARAAPAAAPADPWRAVRGAAGAALLAAALAVAPPPAAAELSTYEYNAGGEFGSGTAQQWGEADLIGHDFRGEDLRRSNFTSANCRKCRFDGAKL
jgi:hypothetical protein